MGSRGRSPQGRGGLELAALLGSPVALLGTGDVGAGARGREPSGRGRVGRAPGASQAVDAESDPSSTSRKWGLKSESPCLRDHGCSEPQV